MAINEVSSRPEGCGDVNGNGIVGYIKKGFNDQSYCDAVSNALGRFASTPSTDDVREVIIQEQNTSATNADRENIVQAYTCVVIDNTLDDYRSTLSSGTPVRVIPLKTSDPNSITGIRILWFTESDGSFASLNYNSREYYFPIDSNHPTPTPPTISAEIIQTGNEFKLEDFNTSSGDTTNRGTVILTPTRSDDTNGKNHIGLDTVVSSNNHSYSRSSHNDPQKIKCQTSLSEEFACVASIELPKPIGGTRRNTSTSEDTFYLVLTLPYANPTTTFAVQLCNDNETGHTHGDCMINEDPNSPSVAQFEDVQISVDSTGRANDMYSRVEARVELSDVFFPFPEFAIHATGSGDGTIDKDFYITSNCIDTSDPNNLQHCNNTTTE